MRKILSLLMLFCMFVGTAWAEELVTGKLYRIMDTSRNKYLTIESYGANSGGQFGTVPVIEKSEGNSDQAWVLEDATNGNYYLKSRSGYYLTLRGWCVDATVDGKGAITFEPAGTEGQYYLKNGSKYFKVEDVAADGGKSHPFCDAPQGHANIVTWIFEEVSASEFPEQISVTYKYEINDRLYASETVKQDKNSEVSVPAMAFLSVVGTEGTIGNSDCEIIVNCKEELPFTLTTDLNSPVWQVVEMHRYGTFRVWDYKENEAAVSVTTVADKENAVADNMLWCFTGNLIDGFKVYNKAAGTEVTLNATANNPMVGTASNGNDVWKLAKSTATNDPAACFTNNGSNYMNQNEGQIKYHSEADNGSTCYFYNPTDFVLDEYASIENVPVGAVGSYILSEEMRASLQTANSAVEANPSDIEKVQALAELIAGAKSSNKVAFVDGGYYRIQNIYRPQSGTKNMIGIVNGERKGATGNQSTVDFIWKIQKANDAYKIQNLNYGTFMSGVSDQKLVDEATAAEYTFAELGSAQWKIQSGGETLVMFYDNGTLGHWGAVNKDGDGAWYIIPATTIDITIGKAGYATTYLPFDVTLPNTVKAYAVTSIEGESAKLIEKTDIPANTGAILESEGTHTLAIAEATSDWTGNLLDGTSVNTYVGNGAYVLAKPTIDEVAQPVGFYKAELNKNAEGAEGDSHFLNNANKAYLPASAVTGNARFISFDFGTETAIDELKGENGNVKTVIYDLSGRRVQGAQKGIFIVNGKKVIK